MTIKMSFWVFVSIASEAFKSLKVLFLVVLSNLALPLRWKVHHHHLTTIFCYMSIVSALSTLDFISLALLMINKRVLVSDGLSHYICGIIDQYNLNGGEFLGSTCILTITTRYRALQYDLFGHNENIWNFSSDLYLLLMVQMLNCFKSKFNHQNILDGDEIW